MFTQNKITCSFFPDGCHTVNTSLINVGKGDSKPKGTIVDSAKRKSSNDVVGDTATCNQCAGDIELLKNLPGAEQCCCDNADSGLFLGVPELFQSLSPICTQYRRCKFLCCEQSSRFCGTNCCKEGEFCGEIRASGDPCCVALRPPVLASKDALEFPELYWQNQWAKCCPFGRGIACTEADRPPCCLDVDPGGVHCVPTEADCHDGAVLWSWLPLIVLIVTLIAVPISLVVVRNQYDAEDEERLDESLLEAEEAQATDASGLEPIGEEERNYTSAGVYGDGSVSEIRH